MNSVNARHFVGYLSKNWDIRLPIDLNRCIDALANAICEECSDYNTFEFSLICGEKAIRLLHLNFYKPMPPRQLNKIAVKRVDLFSSIVQYASKNLGYKYNINIVRETSPLVKEFLLPVQVGCMVNNKISPVFKEYFSVLNNHKCDIIIKRISGLLGIQWGKLKTVFSKSKFDSIGIDFLHDGRCNLKLYTVYSKPFDLSGIYELYRKYQKNEDKYLTSFFGLLKKIPLRHIGFLYRISDKSTIDSVKIWARLRKPAYPGSLITDAQLKTNLWGKWLYSCTDMINSAMAKVSYFTLEDKKLGVYFR